MKAAIYARCSTDEKQQDVEVQLIELRRYCNAYNYHYDEIFEYGSGFKGEQPKLKDVIEKIRLGHYQMLIVYSMDRFSRENPQKINALLDTIVFNYGCRFMALQQGIDSSNELTWNVVKPLFVYFANKYSKDLGQKVKLGIARKKDKGEYEGGRPSKTPVKQPLLELFNTYHSLRKTAAAYNQGKPKKEQISYVTVKKILSAINKDNLREISS